MARIFVSYRREDSPGHSGRLYDHLTHHFGEEQIFRDLDTIEFGEDFVESIQKAVASCDILIAVIGRQWLAVQDAKGRRRLDNPEDFVRLEISMALARNIRVIPVLVNGATMPSADELPPDLAKLARRNAIEISESRFQFDVNTLSAAIDKALSLTSHQLPSEQWVQHRDDASGNQPRGSDAPPAPAPRVHELPTPSPDQRQKEEPQRQESATEPGIRGDLSRMYEILSGKARSRPSQLATPQGMRPLPARNLDIKAAPSRIHSTLFGEDNPALLLALALIFIIFILAVLASQS